MSNITRRGSGPAPAWRRHLDAAAGDRLKRKDEPAANIVQLVVDCSGSMDGKKLRDAKRGAVGFADKALAQGYRVGLVGFGCEAETLAPPLRAISELRPAVERLGIMGSTNMAAALHMATANIGEVTGLNAICIVTDGQPNSQAEALAAGKAAKDKGIDIIAIGTDDADRSFLAKLASRQELAQKVQQARLEQGITDMALLLPKPGS